MIFDITVFNREWRCYCIWHARLREDWWTRGCDWHPPFSYFPLVPITKYHQFATCKSNNLVKDNIHYLPAPFLKPVLVSAFYSKNWYIFVLKWSSLGCLILNKKSALTKALCESSPPMHIWELGHQSVFVTTLVDTRQVRTCFNIDVSWGGQKWIQGF